MKYKLIKNNDKYLPFIVLDNDMKDNELTTFLNFTVSQFQKEVKELFDKVLKGKEKEIDCGFNDTYVIINNEITKIQNFEYEDSNEYYTVNTKKLYRLILKYNKMITIEKMKNKIKINKILTIKLCITLILIVSTFLIGIYFKNYGLIGFFCAIIVALVTQITKILKNKISIIQLDDSIILNKKYMQWEEARKKYSNKIIYNTLPMTYEEVINQFKKDFGREEKWPFPKTCIINFYKSDKKVIKTNLK